MFQFYICFLKSKRCHIGTLLYSSSSLVRTSAGPCSELVRITSERGPNKVRTKEDGEWNKSPIKHGCNEN